MPFHVCTAHQFGAHVIEGELCCVARDSISSLYCYGKSTQSCIDPLRHTVLSLNPPSQLSEMVVLCLQSSRKDQNREGRTKPISARIFFASSFAASKAQAGRV